MIDTEKSSFAWNILFLWAIATAVGLTVSDGIGFFIFPGINLFFLPGTIIASIQWWFVLRQKADKASQWIWVTTGGWAIGLIVGGIGGAIANIIVGIVMGTVKGGESINAGSGIIGTATYLVLHGIALGITQWLFFLRRRYKKAGWWILATMLGVPISYGLFWGVFSPSNVIVTGVLVSVVRGATFGAITGIALSWLFQRPLNKSHINVSESNTD